MAMAAVAVGGLHVGEAQPVVDDDRGLADVDEPGVEVDVGPAQSGDLAASHAGVGGEHERGGESLPVEEAEEGLELRLAPHLHLAPAIGPGAALRWVSERSGVAGERPLADGVVERLAQDAVDVPDGWAG